jgi:hypothetical protein
MAHLITFATSRFDMAKETPNPFNPIAGEHLLIWLGEKLAEHGYEATEPAAEDWGWYMDVHGPGAAISWAQAPIRVKPPRANGRFSSTGIAPGATGSSAETGWPTMTRSRLAWRASFGGMVGIRVKPVIVALPIPDSFILWL